MNAARFHNALRVLLNLTPRQLAEAGVIDANWGSAEASDRDQVIAFMDNPFREAIRMPDANFDKLFALIGSRQPKEETATGNSVDGPQDVLDAIRDLVVAAEEAGWDIGENRDVLNRARDAYADLQIVMADAADDDEVAA